MNSTASGIVFYENGCNYCEDFKKVLNKNEKKNDLNKLLDQIKKKKIKIRLCCRFIRRTR